MSHIIAPLGAILSRHLRSHARSLRITQPSPTRAGSRRFSGRYGISPTLGKPDRSNATQHGHSDAVVRHVWARMRAGHRSPHLCGCASSVSNRCAFHVSTPIATSNASCARLVQLIANSTHIACHAMTLFVNAALEILMLTGRLTM